MDSVLCYISSPVWDNSICFWNLLASLIYAFFLQIHQVLTAGKDKPKPPPFVLESLILPSDGLTSLSLANYSSFGGLYPPFHQTPLLFFVVTNILISLLGLSSLEISTMGFGISKCLSFHITKVCQMDR